MIEQDKLRIILTGFLALVAGLPVLKYL